MNPYRTRQSTDALQRYAVLVTDALDRAADPSDAVGETALDGPMAAVVRRAAHALRPEAPTAGRSESQATGPYRRTDVPAGGTEARFDRRG